LSGNRKQKREAEKRKTCDVTEALAKMPKEKRRKSCEKEKRKKKKKEKPAT